MKHLHLLSTSLCALALSSAGAAQAVIVDVSATSGIATTTTLQAGSYAVSWIDNIANGGFNGWSARLGDTSWREAVSFTIGGTTVTVDKFNSSGSYYNDYAGASAALAAFQSGPYALFVGSSTTPMTVSSTQFSLSGPTSVSFTIPDHPDALWDNSGGVSLSIAAVPEPGTYALMFAGLGAVGFSARRRRSI